MDIDEYFETLRLSAEQKLSSQPIPEDYERMSEAQLRQTLHELSVYRIELEMQSRELLETHQKLVDSLAQQRQQRQHFQNLFNEAPVGYLLLNEQGMIQEANAFFYQKTGLPAELIIGRPFYRFLKAEDQAEFIVRYPAFYKSPTHKFFNLELQLAENRWMSVSLTGSRVQDEQSEPTMLRMIVVDMSEIAALNQELSLTNKVFECSMHGILICDAHNRIQKINAAFTRLTGYTLSDVQGKDPVFLAAEDVNAETYHVMRQMLKNTGMWHGELHNRHKNGSVCDHEMNIFVLKNHKNETTHFIGTLQDITERKQIAKQISHMAEYDQLTDLPNRHLLADRLTQAIKQAQRQNEKLAVMFLDLDHFKSLNDTHGHLVGDELLRQIAYRLRSCLRDVDTLARFGGDEFVIVLGDLRAGDNTRSFIEKVGEKLLVELRQPFQLGNMHYQTSFSIGVATYPDDGVSDSLLLQSADAAMYVAKQGGRNQLRFFDSVLQNKLKNDHQLRQGLRRALEQGEFRLHYQSQTELSSGKIVGLESLIRWQHPERGLLLPEAFLQLAEDDGLMADIDFWVMNEACRQLAVWQQQGSQLVPVSINLTYRQFMSESHLTTTLFELLQQHKLSPELLKIEVTESSVMKDVVVAEKTLSQLRNMGIQIALDDFGTGYSSLTYLRRLPINLLKIDQSFVRNILFNPDDQIIVRSTIAMTQAMNIQIIAEGIESLEQAQLLAEMGCQFGQGYYFSYPNPPQQQPLVLTTGF